MRIIYDLEIALAEDPQRVADTQALTLDTSRPHMGLAREYGLYASEEWWANLKSGAMLTNIYEGPIADRRFIGMHNETRAFTLDLGDGENFTYDLMANRKEDKNLYRIGKVVRVTTFMQPKKTGELLESLWRVEIEDV